ncbi:MAG: glycosyltransferase family 2 protein [Treponema sp.]|nr:glycosyltransferase family 2 protein [Treponema sp.]
MKCNNNPLISVCIPVFETEKYLAQCLRSVFSQDFDSFEVVIVSDASDGRNENGWNAKKIVKVAEKEGKQARKACGRDPVNVVFEVHEENRGILEVRRTMAYKAKGDYIFSLDSDDELLPDSLSTLWSAVKDENGEMRDIVHGSFVSGWYDESGKFCPAETTKCGAIFYGKVSGNEVFHKWIAGKISGNVCAKLIRRELFLGAFDNIPYTECNMADDFLVFFFISQCAKSYFGVKKNVYRYRISSGMSSSRKIDTLLKWRLVCSAASVFTVISQWILDNALPEDEVRYLREQAGFYLQTSLVQMEQTVIPALKAQAYEMLCEYWGPEAVKRVEMNN